MSAGVVLWNGAKDGPNQGYLCFDAPAKTPPSPIRLQIVQGELAEQVVTALEAEPEGYIAHELAQKLRSDRARVNGILHALKRAGYVVAQPLARPVWTGHHFATFRYVWLGGRA